MSELRVREGMIRPCDECGGSGTTYAAMPMADGSIRVTEGHDPRPCYRCAGMPKLKCQRSYHNEPGWMPLTHDVCQGWFHPDPDTVMKISLDFGPDGWVWVARPTPLEVVEE